MLEEHETRAEGEWFTSFYKLFECSPGKPIESAVYCFYKNNFKMFQFSKGLPVQMINDRLLTDQSP